MPRFKSNDTIQRITGVRVNNINTSRDGNLEFDKRVLVHLRNTSLNNSKTTGTKNKQVKDQYVLLFSLPNATHIHQGRQRRRVPRPRVGRDSCSQVCPALRVSQHVSPRAPFVRTFRSFGASRMQSAGRSCPRVGQDKKTQRCMVLHGVLYASRGRNGEKEIIQVSELWCGGMR